MLLQFTRRLFALEHLPGVLHQEMSVIIQAVNRAFSFTSLNDIIVL